MSLKRDPFRQNLQQALTMTAADTGSMHSCGCVGPQNGQPLCPCKMRGVQIKDGRYVLPERDLGPVSVFDEAAHDQR